MTPFEPTIERWRTLFMQSLHRTIDERYQGDTGAAQAARYALLAGGKRVRPILCLLSNAACGGKPEAALPGALAAEFVHTYSLVHDDLPCMDNDDLRRGKPTVHKVFGEAQALLAGDALLTDAFSLLTTVDTATDQPLLAPEQRLAMVRELANAAGGQGMVKGQSLDLHWTARHGAHCDDLDRIHRYKTGRLLGCSAALGALAAGAEPPVVARVRAFGEGLGLAFQILDDVLDESTTTGKSVGKDKGAGKLTYVALMGIGPARAAAAAASRRALAELDGLTPPDGDLFTFAHWLLNRTF